MTSHDDDRAAITALVHGYAERLDAGDLDGVAALFAEADWVSGDRVTGDRVTGHGSEYARRQYDRVILGDDLTPGTRHIISNLVIDVDDDRASASARSYFVVLQHTRPILAGRYHDRFARDGGRGWHLTERVFHADLVGDLGAHYRSV